MEALGGCLNFAGRETALKHLRDDVGYVCHAANGRVRALENARDLKGDSLQMSNRDGVLAGWVYERAGKASVVAARLGVHKAQPYRWRSRSKGSVAYRAIQEARKLSMDAGTDGFPLYVVQLVGAMKEELRKWNATDLIIEWWRLFDHEPVSDAREEIASRGSSWDAFLKAHLDEANVHERLCAVTEVLLEQDIDPRSYNKLGHRVVR